jgi:hypothetical protein
MSLFSFLKGFEGEAHGWLSKKMFLPSDTHKDFNNVTIPVGNDTTQIDHVIVSRYGIFVVETKNLKGWIFGDEKSAKWTQSLYGKKYQFQNPLRQNFRHTKALSDFLGIDPSKIHSMVMFWGECEFKTQMPENVMMKGYTKYIKSKMDVLFTDEEVDQICEAITTGRLPANWTTKQQHLQSLKERHNSEACPKCGSELVLRTAKKGQNAGKQFYGCSGFPACRYARPK